jgi:quercetin dioxygenase-like cupin family protein
MKRINLENSFSDERGAITDLIENEVINAITLITFKKGAVRANHYHKDTVQWNYLISGKVLIRTKEGEGSAVDSIMTAGDFIVTPAKEQHAIQALEDSTLMVFTRGPRGGKEYEVDTFRDKDPLIKPNQQ